MSYQQRREQLWFFAEGVHFIKFDEEVDPVTALSK